MCDHIWICLATQTLSIRPSQRGCSHQMEIQMDKIGKMAVVKERLARKLLFLLWSSTLTVSPAQLISVTIIASRKDQPRRKRRMVLTLRWGLPGQRVFTFHPCLQKEKGLLSQPLSSPLPQKRVEQGKTTNAYFTVCFLLVRTSQSLAKDK